MIETAGAPLHAFMVKQTRMKDVTMFAEMAKSGPYRDAQRHPLLGAAARVRHAAS